MPLRGLLYFAQQFEGLVDVRGENIYGKGRIGLPTPEYIVFYNGSGMETDSQMLYLSDAYSAGHGKGCLECRCKVININRGHNRELMERCHRLWEYAELSAEVEENIRKGMVQHMLLTEYDEKKHLRHTFEEGRQEGLEAGMEKGREELFREQIHKKLSKGKTIPEIAEELETEVSVIEHIVSHP